MALGDSRSDRGLSTVEIFAIAAAAAIAIAVVAYHPKADAGSISLGMEAAARLPGTTSSAQAHRTASNQLATFLERWTSTADTAGDDRDH
ncbi:MAG: hypothetical protein J0J01_09420 [Reyranella sp.]|uniref:hypothetical protein n=1 Tax=Reyranella sp. TaxID=1929291 RepID=UPI001AC37BD8|nr:hypothetical protein [Reyranella sp.]MBN9087115.1 hypothetical protein [Reyranella sp.]